MRLSSWRPHLLLAALLLALLWLSLPTGPARADGVAPAPRLVVVVVVDQFRADYLERFRDQFGANGFNRLLREGAYFTSCFYPYAVTNTAPGHASIATGTTPSRHGIVNNSWYRNDLGRQVPAVFDEEAPLVGVDPRPGGASPRMLMSSTLADQLRLATDNRAKVFGVAIKDRAAIFSTGHTASGAYWYDRETGRFITSRYYGDELPGWVEAFNQRKPADRYYGQDWETGGKVFLSLTSRSGEPDEEFYNRLVFSPYGNEIVLAFAQELVRREGLGRDEVTDFLFLGFSSNDAVGHRWGPYSEEVADMTLRTDEQMATLLEFLDEQVGTGNYWLVLSADHGVAPTLAQARAQGLPAKNVDARGVLERVERALDDEFGAGDWLLPGAPPLTLNRETLEQNGVGLRRALHGAGGAVLGVEGVRGYVATGEVRLEPELAIAVRLSLYRGRSPDLYFVLEPFALVNGERGGTTHGSPYAYDTQVPLIFYGPAFRAGVYPEKVSPIDLAPTLAAALRINPPALSSGNVLAQALKME